MSCLWPERFSSAQTGRETAVRMVGRMNEIRHTFVTNCYYMGVNVKVLSKLLGHADVNVTYNIYVHLYGDGFDEMYSALVSEKIEKEPFFFKKSSHGRGSKIRTHNKGFGDPRVTITPCPYI